MPYVPPASCPPIGQAPAAILALYVVIARRTAADMELACEILDAGPEFFPAYVEQVEQRSREHVELVAAFMQPLVSVYRGLDGSPA